MSARSSPPSADRCRDLARQLHRQFQSDDQAQARIAAARFRCLRSFAALSPDELLAQPDRVQRKHALLVIALEQGFESWLDLLRASAGAAAGDVEMYCERLTLYLNRWFADYDEARASLASEGGFLLPYGKYCFITTADGIRELGLDPDDPDWARIGRDFVRPADPAAHARLLQRRREAIGT